jgi:ribosomal protein S18 acetylase RimI-like enzyme
MKIRLTVMGDTDSLMTLTERTGVFKPHELDALLEVLDDYHETNHEDGHCAMTAEIEGRIVGFVYYGPVPMTDHTWDLWWIAVDPATQGQGIGAKLMSAAEDDMRSKGGRLLTLDTSATAVYQPTRSFYERIGYTLMATLPDYYTDGDGKCIFWKRLK